MTPELYTKVVELEREFQRIGRQKLRLSELSDNLLLQAEAYGCGGDGKDIAETTAESVKIFLTAHPEYILDVCHDLILWADKEASICVTAIEDIKDQVSKL